MANFANNRYNLGKNLNILVSNKRYKRPHKPNSGVARYLPYCYYVLPLPFRYVTFVGPSLRIIYVCPSLLSIYRTLFPSSPSCFFFSLLRLMESVILSRHVPLFHLPTPAFNADRLNNQECYLVIFL
jgi:hypothetical protein